MIEKWAYPLIILGMAAFVVWGLSCAPRPQMTPEEIEKRVNDSLFEVRCREGGGKIVHELDGVRSWCE